MNDGKMSVVLESLADTIIKLRTEVLVLNWERDRLNDENETLRKSNESLAHQLNFEMRKDKEND